VTSPTLTSTADPEAPLTPTASGPRPQLRKWLWLIEVAVLLGLYMLYSQLRTLVEGPEVAAFTNARTVADIERSLGLAFESPLQRFFLGHYNFISFWNIYYGTIHFVMPVVALVWLYRKAPARYVRWRNTLLILLGIGVVAFWAYPLAPPRLMPTTYGFIDTAIGYTNFGKPATTKSEAGNFYAAMPSLHMGWSTWCTCALWPMMKRWWWKPLLVAYPACTLFAIVITGNHWWLDAVGGWIALSASYGLATLGAVLYARFRAAKRASAVAAANA
jgi:hypothetical protein